MVAPPCGRYAARHGQGLAQLDNLRAPRARRTRAGLFGAADGGELDRRRNRLRLPRPLRRRHLARLRGEVQQHAEQLGAGNAVDAGVVDLGQQRDAAARQPFDEVHTPQRHAAVEARAHDVADEVGELAVVAGARQRAMAHVVLDVELGVLDPVRIPELKRILDETTANLSDYTAARYGLYLVWKR